MVSSDDAELVVSSVVIVDFVKGHMGGDEIILLDGRQIPKRYNPMSARDALKPPNIRGREVGLLYPPQEGGDIRVKIYELTPPGPTPMCGGLTQVLGKALGETNLARRFSIRLKKPRNIVRLETDAGVIPIQIIFRAHEETVMKVKTGMKSYVRSCYEWGREESDLDDIPAERVGEYYFIDWGILTRKYPGVDFTRSSRECLEVIDKLRAKKNLEKMYAVVKKTGEPGHIDVAFRFVPPDALALEGEEFACGTGSTTTAVYEVFHNRLPIDSKGRGHLTVRLLNRGALPVDQRTEVDVEVRNGRVIDAWFSHNYVRMIAEGKVTI